MAEKNVTEKQKIWVQFGVFVLKYKIWGVFIRKHPIYGGQRWIRTTEVEDVRFTV